MVMGRFTCTVGRLVAREFRRGVRDYGLAYDEDKGWLDSHFVVTGPADKVARFRRAAMAWAETLA